MYILPFKDVIGSRIIFAGLSKWFTKTDNDCNPESNYAIYSAFGTSIENKPCSTDKYKEPRSESINKVKISPWVETMEMNDEDSNVNDDYVQDVVDLIDIGEIRKGSLELIETYDTELDTGMKLIDCKDISETKYFSKPESGLDTDVKLIDCGDVSESTYFSETKTDLLNLFEYEPSFDCPLKYKGIEFEMPSGIYIGESKINT